MATGTWGSNPTITYDIEIINTKRINNTTMSYDIQLKLNIPTNKTLSSNNVVTATIGNTTKTLKKKGVSWKGTTTLTQKWSGITQPNNEEGMLNIISWKFTCTGRSNKTGSVTGVGTWGDSSPALIQPLPTITLPNSNILIAWSAAEAGVSNPIDHYELLVDDIVVYSGQNLEYVWTAPSTRGVSHNFQIKSVAEKDEQVSTTHAILINERPNAPTIESINGRLYAISTEEIKNIKAYPGAANQGWTDTTIYYYTANNTDLAQPYENQPLGTGPTNSTITYWFWTYDGAEFSDSNQITIVHYPKPEASIVLSYDTHEESTLWTTEDNQRYVVYPKVSVAAVNSVVTKYEVQYRDITDNKLVGNRIDISNQTDSFIMPFALDYIPRTHTYDVVVFATNSANGVYETNAEYNIPNITYQIAPQPQLLTSANGPMISNNTESLSMRTDVQEDTFWDKMTVGISYDSTVFGPRIDMQPLSLTAQLISSNASIAPVNGILKKKAAENASYNYIEFNTLSRVSSLSTGTRHGLNIICQGQDQHIYNWTVPVDLGLKVAATTDQFFTLDKSYFFGLPARPLNQNADDLIFNFKTEIPMTSTVWSEFNMHSLDDVIVEIGRGTNWYRISGAGTTPQRVNFNRDATVPTIQVVLTMTDLFNILNTTNILSGTPRDKFNQNYNVTTGLSIRIAFNNLYIPQQYQWKTQTGISLNCIEEINTGSSFKLVRHSLDTLNPFNLNGEIPVVANNQYVDKNGLYEYDDIVPKFTFITKNEIAYTGFLEYQFGTKIQNTTNINWSFNWAVAAKTNFIPTRTNSNMYNNSEEFTVGLTDAQIVWLNHYTLPAQNTPDKFINFRVRITDAYGHETIHNLYDTTNIYQALRLVAHSIPTLSFTNEVNGANIEFTIEDNYPSNLDILYTDMRTEIGAIQLQYTTQSSFSTGVTTLPIKYQNGNPNPTYWQAGKYNIPYPANETRLLVRFLYQTRSKAGITKTFISPSVYIYNIAPLISYREGMVGINAKGLDSNTALQNGALVVMPINQHNYIYFKNRNHFIQLESDDIPWADSNPLPIEGFAIDGGEWVNEEDV